jgi:acetyl-CoA synthetase
VPKDVYPVKPHIRERAHIRSLEEYERLYRLSLDSPEWFWAEQARTLDWFHPWHHVLDADYEQVDFAWYSGGGSTRASTAWIAISSAGRTHRDHLGG